MDVEVKVLVPADRLGAFQVAHGPFAAGGEMGAATAGSTGGAWTEVTVRMPAARVPGFYSAFARWLKDATSPAAAASPHEEVRREEFTKEAWDTFPSAEQEFLHLLADEGRGVVAWSDLRDKLRLPPDPDPKRDLPTVAGWCTGLQRKLPLTVSGTGETAAVALLPAIIPLVRQYQ